MPILTLGQWNVRTIETGPLWLDGGSMFGSVPKPMWSKSHPADDRNRIQLAMRCLLIEGEGRRVLVDVGAGDKMAPKLVDIYGLDPEPRPLERALQAAGVAAEDVTDVVLTHLHFDHAGGSTRREGDRLVPTLPRARYHLQRKNWDNASAPNPRERASYMPENFQPLMDARVLTLGEGPQTLWPGFELFTADGHTRGQQLLRLEGGGTTLYYVADLIPTRSHVRLPFVMGYDVCAIQTMEEKEAVLDRAAGEGAWICLEHDPQVAFARPRRNGEDFEWAETVAADGAASTQGAAPASGGSPRAGADSGSRSGASSPRGAVTD
jgi:glyoxylase-like metal-dependent hydrolase (beta-lactamase superfamily II)